MVKKCFLKLSRTSKNRHSALGPTEEVQFDSQSTNLAASMWLLSEKKSDKRHLITINLWTLIRNIWLHHNINFVTNKNSLDVSQFVTRVLSEFTEPNKDEERVILQ